MDTQDAVKVAAFGSCRVFTPLARAQSQGIVQTTHQGIEWYTHSPGEAAQKADIVRCALEVPEDILPLLIDTKKKYNSDAHHADKFSTTEVVVLELAAIKRINYGSWHIQQWRHRGVLNKSDVEVSRRTFEIAEQCTVVELSEDEYLSDIENFKSKLDKPLVLVPHLTCSTFPEPVLRPRLKIRHVIERFCKQHNDAIMYDPTETVVEHGEEIALVDSGHYQPQFNKVIGSELGQACRKLRDYLA